MADTDRDALDYISRLANAAGRNVHELLAEIAKTAEAALRARLAPTHADDEAQADTDLNILDIRALDRRWSRRHSIDTRELRARAEKAEAALAECRDKTIEECAAHLRQKCGHFDAADHIRALKKEPRDG